MRLGWIIGAGALCALACAPATAQTGQATPGKSAPSATAPLPRDTGDCVWRALGDPGRKAVIASLSTSEGMDSADKALVDDPGFRPAVEGCRVDFERNMPAAIGMTVGGVMSRAVLEILIAKGYDRARLQRAWDASPASDRAEFVAAAKAITNGQKAPERGDISGLLKQLQLESPMDELLAQQIILYYLMKAVEAEGIAAAR